MATMMNDLTSQLETIHTKFLPRVAVAAALGLGLGWPSALSLRNSEVGDWPAIRNSGRATIHTAAGCAPVVEGFLSHVVQYCTWHSDCPTGSVG
jgi:hypothetical protein